MLGHENLGEVIEVGDAVDRVKVATGCARRSTSAAVSARTANAEDPGAPDELSQQGELAFDFGKFFQKGLRMGSGQANVKAYNRQRRELIAAGKASPSFLVSHEVALDTHP